MSREHDPSHEEVLAALVTTDADRGELRRRIEGCPVCEEKLRQLDVVADLLSTTGGSRHSLHTDALPPFEPGEEAGARRLRELAAGEFPREQAGAAPADLAPGGSAPASTPPPTERPRPPTLLVVALAAAAGILLFVLPRLGDDAPVSDPPDDIFIGAGAIELLSPAGTVARGDLTVSWKGELVDEGDAFLLRLQDLAGDDLPGSPRTLTEMTWTPTPAQVAAWPDVVRIQIARVDFLGDEDQHTEWHVVELAP